MVTVAGQTYLKSFAQFRSLLFGEVHHECFHFDRQAFVLARLFFAGAEWASKSRLYG